MTKQLVADNAMVFHQTADGGNACSAWMMRALMRADGDMTDDEIERWLFEHVEPHGEG